MPEIKLVNINKYICTNINLTIRDKEILVIVGVTGSGKTTLLNVIAGITDYKGNVFIDNLCVDGLCAKERGIGYMFQGLALFPHLTVEANIAFPLKILKLNKSEIKKQVLYLMEMMRIKDLKDRYPSMLSGGEKKRVALARSLAPSPKILLLDEPTSSLDHQTSKYLRNNLVELLKKLKITTIYVTHDLREAEEIADRIALLHQGKLEQVSTVKEFFFNPENEKVSEFIGMPNILTCSESRIIANGLVEVISDNMRIILPYEGNNLKKIAIPPEDIYISDIIPPGPALNRFKGKVEHIVKESSYVKVKIKVNGKSLISELPITAFNELSIEEGKEVYVVIKLRRLRYIDK